MCVDHKHGGRQMGPRIRIPKPLWSLCSVQIGPAFVDTWRVPTEHLFASMQYWLCFAQKACRVFCSRDGIMPSRYENFQAYRVAFIEARNTMVKAFDRKQMQAPFSKQKNHSAVHRTCLLCSIITRFFFNHPIWVASVGLKSLEKSENVQLSFPQKSYIVFISMIAFGRNI